jgi:hypothetical protein
MKMSRSVVLLVALLILGGCTREEATAQLRGDLQPEDLEIIHARFPCRSPEMHFFGYRFRIKVQNEYADGYICWNVRQEVDLANSTRVPTIASQHSQITLVRIPAEIGSGRQVVSLRVRASEPAVVTRQRLGFMHHPRSCRSVMRANGQRTTTAR